MTTIVIRRTDGSQDRLKADAAEVDKQGSLIVYNTEVSARYMSAIYTAGDWLSAYCDVVFCADSPKADSPEAKR